MPDVSLTVFARYVLTAGTPRQTIVAAAKSQSRTAYDPQTDFWKKLRDEIIAMHRTGAASTALTAVASGVVHPPKAKAYPVAVKGYQKWLGRSVPTWFTPPSQVWT